jgi:hypothetical protein
MRDHQKALLEARLQEIAAISPELAGDARRILFDAGPDVSAPVIEIRSTRSGADSLRLNGKWLHSSFDPVKEAHRRVREHKTSDTPRDAIVILGLGLGYLCEAWDSDQSVEGHSDVKIAVVFHPSLLRTILLNRSSEGWQHYGPERIIPAWLPGLMVPVLQHLQIRSFLTLPLSPLRDAYPEMVATIENVLDNYRERTEVNKNTLRRFGQLWVRNTIRSIRQFGIHPGVDHLVHIAPGTPVVVCAAGPTLDDVLPRLATAADQALIIAVDTAVIALQNRGIQPDLAVISDPQYWNTRHLDQISATSAILVAEPATHPRTLRLWPGPAMMSASLFPLGAYIDSRTLRRLKLGSGGSVATSAWDLARVIGSTSIAMAGTDLGFPRYRTHCSGSFFETRLTTVAHRLEPAEHGLWRYLHGARAVMTPSAGGDVIPSDARMKVYRSWFSERPLQYPEISTVLLSPESSAIPGIPFESVDEWLRANGDPPRVAEAREALRGSPMAETFDATPILNELLESLRDMEHITKSGLDVCTEIRKEQNALDDALLLRRMESLDAIDERLGALDDREIVGFISGSILEEISAGHAATAGEALDQAETLYRTLHHAATFHLDLLHRYDFG